MFAPPFGVVVLSHKEPVGRGFVSVDLNVGTLVCAPIEIAGE